MSSHGKISRRSWLKGVAAFSATAVTTLMLASTAAEVISEPSHPMAE
jgi:hypothetical protein